MAAAFALALVAVALLGKVFSVEPFLELFVGGVAYGLDLAGEMQRLAGHRVVEVHSHGFFTHCGDGALDHLSFGIEHRQHASYDEQLRGGLAVDCESLQRQLYEIFRIVGAVAFLGRKREFERVAGNLSVKGLFKFGQQHSCAVDILEGCFGSGLVGDFAFNFKGVADRYDFVFLNLHFFSN